jgi:hypothetical protein
VTTEQDGPDAAHPGSGPQTRLGTAQLTLSLAARHVRSSVLRLLDDLEKGHYFRDSFA